MTAAEILPFSAILEQLDFEPACVVGHFPESTWPQCESPAEWVLRWDCGCIDLYCTPHADYFLCTHRAVPTLCGNCPDQVITIIDAQRIKP